MATASDTPILEIAGELDMHHAAAVKDELTPLIEARTARVLVDLSRVTYIDSSGLALFIETLQRIQGYGGKLALFGLPDGVRHIFEIARLDQVFHLYPDKTAALAAT